MEFLKEEIRHTNYTSRHDATLEAHAENIMTRPKKTTRRTTPGNNLSAFSEDSNSEVMTGHTTKIATITVDQIGVNAKGKSSDHCRPLGQVYSIPRGGCDKVYRGKTGCGLHGQRMGQHSRAL